MSDTLTPFHDAIRARIASTWADVLPNGIYRDLELAEFTNLSKKAEDAELPFAVFQHVGREGTEWGLTNRVTDGQLIVIRVAADSETFDQMLVKLQLLRDALYASGSITPGQCVNYPDVMERVNSPILNSFFANTQRPYRAGGVMCRAIVGETAS